MSEIADDPIDPALAGIAADLVAALQDWHLPAWRRRQIYERALTLAGSRTAPTPWRAWIRPRWVPAAIGGAVVAAAAGAAIGIALSRGRRTQPAASVA